MVCHYAERIVAAVPKVKFRIPLREEHK